MDCSLLPSTSLVLCTLPLQLFLTPTLEDGIVMIPILQLRKLRLREVMQLSLRPHKE